MPEVMDVLYKTDWPCNLCTGGNGVPQANGSEQQPCSSSIACLLQVTI